MNQFQATGNKLETSTRCRGTARLGLVGVYRDAEIQSLFLTCRKKCSTGPAEQC